MCSNESPVTGHPARVFRLVLKAVLISLLALLAFALPRPARETSLIAGARQLDGPDSQEGRDAIHCAPPGLRDAGLAGECAVGMWPMGRFSLEIAVDGVDPKTDIGQAYLDNFAAQTNCTPARRDCQINPNDPEVMHHAIGLVEQTSLSVPSARLLTSPILLVSLQSPEDTMQIYPRAGFNLVDGPWLDNEFKYHVGALAGILYGKVAALSGFIPRNALTYSQADFTASFTLGRNQDKDLEIYDQAELVLEVSDRPGSTLPSFSVSEGWFREPLRAVETSRFQYLLGLNAPAVALSGETSWAASASWQDAFYGTGARQGVLRLDGAITIQIDSPSSLKLGYDRLGVFGTTPFAFDAIDPKDLINDLSLEYFRTVVREVEVTSTFHYGVSYSFLDQTPSLIIGYKEDDPERFNWGLDAEYDLVSQDVKLTTNSGLAIGRGTNFSIHAIYHSSTGQFEDLDYLITSQLRECINLELQYRQVRQEIFLEIDSRPCAPS